MRFLIVMLLSFIGVNRSGASFGAGCDDAMTDTTRRVPVDSLDCAALQRWIAAACMSTTYLEQTKPPAWAQMPDAVWSDLGGEEGRGERG